MSLSDSQHTNALNEQIVGDIAKLAKLSLSPQQTQNYAESLNKILHMMDSLQNFATDGVEPLRSPFDLAQPLREDVVTEQNQREKYQSIAPAIQDGLYLVPRVIE